MKLKIIHHREGRFFALVADGLFGSETIVQRTSYNDALGNTGMERACIELTVFAKGYQQGITDARALLNVYLDDRPTDWAPPPTCPEKTSRA
jgi:hypothetical protein